MENTDTFYNMVIQELTDGKANADLERAVFKARYSDAEERVQVLEARLAVVDAVFTANPELKELFEEEAKKLEENDGSEQK